MDRSEAVVKIAKSMVVGGICCCLLACGLTVGLWHRKELNADFEKEVKSPSLVLPKDGNYYGAYLAGYMAQKNQDYEKTSHYFERVLVGDPDNQKIKTSLYFLNIMQGKFDEMMPLVHEIATLNRPELLAEYVLIAAAVRNGDYQKARNIVEQKTDYGLDSILLPVVKAWLWAGSGDKNRAFSSLAELDQDPKMKPLFLYYSGLLNSYFGDMTAADDAFLKLTQFSVPSLTAFVFAQDFYEKQGLWKSGESVYDYFQKAMMDQSAAFDVVKGLTETTQITPAVGLAVVFYDVSVALGPLGVEETSLMFNELSLYLDPDATIPKIWGAEVFESIKGYRAANRMYDRVHNPSDIILFKKAINLMAQEDYESALPVLKNIGLRNTGNPLVQRLLAETYFQLGYYPEAIRSYHQAILVLRQGNQAEDLGRALFELGAVYHEMGDFEKSEKTLLDALRVDPNNALILNYLGYSWLEREKNVDQAFEMVKKANESMPDDPHIMDSLALGYYYKKEYQKALALAERATDMIPYSAVAYSHLGDIYMALGRSQEALYQYKRALELKIDMTDDLRRQLQEKIEGLIVSK